MVLEWQNKFKNIITNLWRQRKMALQPKLQSSLFCGNTKAVLRHHHSDAIDCKELYTELYNWTYQTTKPTDNTASWNTTTNNWNTNKTDKFSNKSFDRKNELFQDLALSRDYTEIRKKNSMVRANYRRYKHISDLLHLNLNILSSTSKHNRQQQFPNGIQWLIQHSTTSNFIGYVNSLKYSEIHFLHKPQKRY